MSDLYVRSVSGLEEMLTHFEVSRKDSVDEGKTIDVKVIKNKINEHAYALIYNQNIFIYKDEEYIIKKMNEKTKGNTVIRTCKAIHRVFEDLKGNHIYEQISGTFHLNQLLEFALKGTGYKIKIHNQNLPLSVLVENFGDDKSLDLFKNILEKFGAEFDVKGREITVMKEIGSYTDEQFRYYFNVKDPSQDIDTTSFATYIRGYGKKNEDGSYVVTAEYTSPLAKIYGIKHAKPIRDEKYTHYESLLERIIRELNDSIDISVKLTAVEAEALGWQDIRKGDYVWCIIDPFELDVRIRVVEIEDFSDDKKSSLYTLGTIKRKASHQMASLKIANQTTKKEINDTKITVIQTQQVVNKAVEDISSATIDVSELKSSLVITNKTISEQSGEINNLKHTVQSLESSVGGIVIPKYDVVTETKDGLMSTADKKKLNLIKYSGQVEIDLSILVQKINGLEQDIIDLNEKHHQLDSRVKVLEENKTF